MPTKRMFDLVVLTVILIHPVKGLVKMVATRKAGDPNDTGVMGNIVSGAVRIAS